MHTGLYLPFLRAGSGCILVFFGIAIWGELAASVSMLRGVAGREDGRGVSAIEFFLESDGGGFTLDTKEGREREGTREKGRYQRRKTKREDHSNCSSHKTEVYIAYLKALAVLGLQEHLGPALRAPHPHFHQWWREESFEWRQQGE